jgi:Ycf66 protein N-terminus
VALLCQCTAWQVNFRMLTYILSVLVGTGSVALYLAAFVMPELYRPKDLLWSGLGLFYALVLWINGRELSGGLLLGQALSVVLLGWFAWETLALRRQIVPAAERTPLPNADKTSITGGTPVATVLTPIAMDKSQPWIEIRQEFPTANPEPPESAE